MTPVGLPHSEISGSMRACRSPKHIAACHVLLRLSVPRHPPSTLSNLTIKCLDLMRSAVARLSTCCAFLFYNPYSIVKERAACAATFSSSLSASGGDDRSRTGDPLLAKQVLSQLSYIPLSYISKAPSGGPSWGRTRDLALIKRAL